jgi:hypothetical protein
MKLSNRYAKVPRTRKGHGSLVSGVGFPLSSFFLCIKSVSTISNHLVTYRAGPRNVYPVKVFFFGFSFCSFLSPFCGSIVVDIELPLRWKVK